MAMQKNQLYYVAAVLAGLAAILQFIDGKWFRGGTSAALAGAMVLAATGFPEKSPTHRRIYFAVLVVVIGAMFIRLFGWMG